MRNPEMVSVSRFWQMSKDSHTVTLIHLREVAKRLYIVLEPHPGLQPYLNPKRVNPPTHKGCWITMPWSDVLPNSTSSVHPQVFSPPQVPPGDQLTASLC
jgi:hypothetical protein